MFYFVQGLFLTRSFFDEIHSKNWNYNTFRLNMQLVCIKCIRQNHVGGRIKLELFVFPDFSFSQIHFSRCLPNVVPLWNIFHCSRHATPLSSNNIDKPLCYSIYRASMRLYCIIYDDNGATDMHAPFLVYSVLILKSINCKSLRHSYSDFFVCPRNIFRTNVTRALLDIHIAKEFIVKSNYDCSSVSWQPNITVLMNIKSIY